MKATTTPHTLPQNQILFDTMMNKLYEGTIDRKQANSISYGFGKQLAAERLDRTTVPRAH